MVVNPEINNKTKLPLSSNSLYCGALLRIQKPQSHTNDLKSVGVIYQCWHGYIAWLFKLCGEHIAK